MERNPPVRKMKNQKSLIASKSKYFSSTNKLNISNVLPHLKLYLPTSLTSEVKMSSNESTSTSQYDHFNDINYNKFMKLKKKYNEQYHNKRNPLKLSIHSHTIRAYRSNGFKDLLLASQCKTMNNTERTIDDRMNQCQKLLKITNNKSSNKLDSIDIDKSINNTNKTINKNNSEANKSILSKTNVSFYKGVIGNIFNKEISINNETTEETVKKEPELKDAYTIELNNDMNSTFKKGMRCKLTIPDSYIKYNSFLIRQKRYKNSYINDVIHQVISPKASPHKTSLRNLIKIDRTDYYVKYKDDIFNKENDNEDIFINELSHPESEIKVHGNVDYINHTYYNNSYIIYELLLYTKLPEDSYDNTSITLIHNFIINNQKAPTFIFYNKTLNLPKFQKENKSYMSNFISRTVNSEVLNTMNNNKEYEMLVTNLKQRSKFAPIQKGKKRKTIVMMPSVLQSISNNIKEIADNCDIENKFNKTKTKMNNYSILSTKEMFFHPIIAKRNLKARRVTQVFMSEIKRKEKESKLQKNRKAENAFLISAGITHPSCEYSKIKTQELHALKPTTRLLSKFINLVQEGKTETFVKDFCKAYDIIDDKDKKKGDTLLIAAVKNNNKDIVTFLIESGADVNKANDYGNTPLHFAFSNKNYDIVNLLLKNNANEGIRNLKGQSPWECVDNVCD